MKNDKAADIAICPCGTSEVKIISLIYDGTYWLGVHFLRGRGKSFNIYTRGYLRVGPSGHNETTLWEGWLSGMPEPRDSGSTDMYTFVARNARVRRWIARQIEQYQATIARV